MKYAYAIWQRGHRFKVSRNAEERGWSFITYHMGTEEQAKKCAQAMQEDHEARREGRRVTA